MDTPIVDFVKAYAQSGKARFHMPGHKGVSFFACEQFDITEIRGADELYVPQGIILESEKNAASVFGTSRTVYSAGGSTQSIQAMLFAAYRRADKRFGRPFVLAGRNAHKAFIYAAAKLGFDVEWLYPELDTSICSCIVTAQMLESHLRACAEKPFAVYITSPDYLGGISDIASLSAVCRAYGVPLLVDNAHGAYLAFCKENIHPICLGADLCCDSAHKTLPVLTGGGYLHVSKDDVYGFADSVVGSMAVFGSTSPSYLIMQSLDLCNRYMSEQIRVDTEGCLACVEDVRAAMKGASVRDISAEPLKITADFRNRRVVGFETPGDYFRSRGIEPEYSDRDFVVFMASPFNRETDFSRLKSAFGGIALAENFRGQVGFVKGKSTVSIRYAVFAANETVAVSDSLGRICAAPTVSCPPAIPIAVSGEMITDAHIKLFDYYSVKEIDVVNSD